MERRSPIFVQGDENTSATGLTRIARLPTAGCPFRMDDRKEEVPDPLQWMKMRA